LKHKGGVDRSNGQSKVLLAKQSPRCSYDNGWSDTHHALCLFVGLGNWHIATQSTPCFSSTLHKHLDSQEQQCTTIYNLVVLGSSIDVHEAQS